MKKGKKVESTKLIIVLGAFVLLLSLIFFQVFTGHAVSNPFICGPNQKIGDVNGDGVIDNTDATLVAQFYVGSISGPSNICCADVNKDGKIDVVDSLRIARIAQGLDPTVGVCNPTNQTSTCTDSDGEADYYTRGTATDSSGTSSDVCSSDGKTLTEYFCSNNFKTSVDYNCPNGCNDGACLNPSTNYNLNNPSCTDTDNGIDWTVKGKISGVDNFGNNYKLYDSCEITSEDLSKGIVGKESLFEMYCSSYSEGGPKLYWTTKMMNCPHGCVDGACLNVSSSNEFCTDSDGGINYNVRGKIVSTYYAGIDTCDVVNSNVLIEYSCSSPSSWKIIHTSYGCPNGCKDGACLPSGSGVSITKTPTSNESTNTATPTRGTEITSPTGENKNVSCTSGCLFVNSCLPYGYRTAISYCDVDNNLVKQISTGNCKNNFECVSNVCVEGQCTTVGLFSQFINWFKVLFGAK